MTEQETHIPRLSPGDLAPDVLVRDPNGQELPLSQLWSAGPAILAFLRHFG